MIWYKKTFYGILWLTFCFRSTYVVHIYRSSGYIEHFLEGLKYGSGRHPQLGLLWKLYSFEVSRCQTMLQPHFLFLFWLSQILDCIIEIISFIALETSFTRTFWWGIFITSFFILVCLSSVLIICKWEISAAHKSSSFGWFLDVGLHNATKPQIVFQFFTYNALKLLDGRKIAAFSFADPSLLKLIISLN